MNQPNLWLCGVLILGGILLHGVKKGYEAEQQGTLIKPLNYAKTHPYAIAMMLLSSYLLMAFWFFIGELTYVTSILTGVGCNSAFDTLRVRAEAKMRV